MADVFKEMRDMAQAAVERIKNPTKSRKQIDAITNRDAYINKLKVESEECARFYSDERYPKQRQFLTELRKELSEALVRVCGNSKSKDEQILQAVRLSSWIECVDLISSRPDRIIEELKNINKVL